MRLTFKTGLKDESIEVDEKNVISVLNPPSLPSGDDAVTLLNQSLDHPVNTLKLEQIVRPGEKIVIVISDNTRPVPSYIFLPCILERLHAGGVKDQDIQIVIARGSHRNLSEAEMEKLTGKEVYQHIRVTNSGAHGYVHLGFTSRNTPVDIDRDVVQADRRILTGNVEFHYFAGFSGGAKAIFPGCADPECIQYNHRHMTDENACAGKIEGNPVRGDLEEAADMTGADFILNVVLNTRKEIIYAACGDIEDAHRDACRYLRNVYLSPIHEKADIVIVSQGGAPKDINLYQTQKALDNARYAVKEGGVIILVGSCREGFGNPVFEEWMKTCSNPDEILSHLHEHFALGGHKAAAIAAVRKKADILLVSEMNPDDLKNTVITPCRSLAEAYEAALKKCGKDAKIIAMPYGGSTLPVLK